MILDMIVRWKIRNLSKMNLRSGARPARSASPLTCPAADSDGGFGVRALPGDAGTGRQGVTLGNLSRTRGAVVAQPCTDPGTAASQIAEIAAMK